MVIGSMTVLQVQAEQAIVRSQLDPEGYGKILIMVSHCNQGLHERLLGITQIGVGKASILGE